MTIIVGLLSRTAAASIAVPLTLDALAGHADVIVLGRVTSQVGIVDPVLGGIYTTVTIQSTEVFKGDLGDGPLVVKQQGGIAGTRGAYVTGQARFADGELVLVFLGTRQRDGSLFTIGLWQGKWTIDLDAATGQPHASKVEPESQRILSRRPLADVRLDLQRLVPQSVHRLSRPTGPDPLLPDDRLRSSFALRDPPIRWFHSPGVNIETASQPGLSGGGIAQIVAAMSQWNGAGSALTLRTGTRLPARCLDSTGSDILVTFNDPCGEISSDPTVLATTAYGFEWPGQVVGGRTFYAITDAVITTSASVEARGPLNIAPCFQTIMLHELGHAIGLDHSSDPSAVMFFENNSACVGGPLSLTADDVAGLFTIYPAGTLPPTGGAPAPPTVITAVASGAVLNVQWTIGSGPAPTSHRLDFFAGASLVATVHAGPGNTMAIPIPPGTSGTFSVQVTAFSGIVASPPSTAFLFAVGVSPTAGCTSAPATPEVTGAIAGGTATVSWAPVPGAASYIVSAGSSLGAANIAPAGNVGASTSVSASGLPAGFNAWVRVVAVNACGQSAPRDFFLSSGTVAPVPGGAAIQFVSNASTCTCWSSPISIEIDGQAVGSMSCSGTAGPFPVSPGLHGYRVCSSTGCVGRATSVVSDAILELSVVCQ